MIKYKMVWRDSDGSVIVLFFCSFKKNEPFNKKGEENIPFLDPACTISLRDVGLVAPNIADAKVVPVDEEVDED